MGHWDGRHYKTLGRRTLRDIKRTDTGREDIVRYCDGGHCEELGGRTL